MARENPLLDAQRWQVIFNLAESSKPGSRQRQQLCSDRPPGKLPSPPSAPRAPRAGPQPRGSTVPSGTALVSEIGNLTLAPSCGEVEGAVQIRHPNRCQMAAAAYGKKYIGIMKSFGEPHGCLHRKFDQDMMFNRLQTNVTKKAMGSGDKNVMRILTPWSNTGVGMAINPSVGIYTTILRVYGMGWMTINHVPCTLTMADIMKGAHIPDIS